MSAQSCITHGSEGEFCLPIGSGDARLPGDNVEPRFCGTDKIVVTFVGPVDAASLTVSVACVDNAGQPIVYSPTITASQAVFVDKVQLDFSAPLPNILGPSCCTLTFGGSGTGDWSVASVPGDVSRDLSVTVGDQGLVKPKIGNPLIDLPSPNANFWFDLDCGGTITVGDQGLVKPKIGVEGSLPSCP
ncbi:MAG: hypothetical protein ACYSVY_22970 [Planctomycetota bacterium]|jgi:hypothetical protein